jgi:hypothetical protein
VNLVAKSSTDRSYAPGRLQFAIGPEAAPIERMGITHDLAPGLVCSVDAETNVTSCAGPAGRFTLIGYMLDPDAPAADDRDILERVARSARSAEQLLRATDRLGGRWLLVADLGDRVIAVPDCVGLRQLHFGNGQGGLWCASRADTVAAITAAEPDAAAREWARSFQQGRSWGGAFLPGDLSPWSGVRRLLPNHVLDLRTGAVSRVWPRSQPAPQALDTVVTETAALFRGQLDAARRRWPLALLVTAGSDSRLLLAACRDFIDDVVCVTIDVQGFDPDDVATPGVLAEKLGFRHEVVVAEPAPTSEFWARYEAHSPAALPQYAANAEALAAVVHDRVAVTGHAAGVPKRIYRGSRFSTQLSGSRLALELGFGESRFAQDAMQTWLTDVGTGAGYDVRDLLYWEQRAGTWVPSWLLEYDLVWRDCLVPFACRQLLTTMLAAPVGERSKPEYTLWRRVAEECWPEVLDRPFGGNPRRKKSLVYKARRAIRHLRAG